MKYRNDYITKLEATLTLVETMQKALESNIPISKSELVQITKNIKRILNFVLERIELESD